MEPKKKEKAIKKKFQKLQNDHKEINGAKARGKLAVAELKGTDWLHKKVTELKSGGRHKETSTKTGGRKKETSTKTKIAVSAYYCYILLSIIINYIL